MRELLLSPHVQTKSSFIAGNVQKYLELYTFKFSRLQQKSYQQFSRGKGAPQYFFCLLKCYPTVSRVVGTTMLQDLR